MRLVSRAVAVNSVSDNDDICVYTVRFYARKCIYDKNGHKSCTNRILSRAMKNGNTNGIRTRENRVDGCKALMRIVCPRRTEEPTCVEKSKRKLEAAKIRRVFVVAAKNYNSFFSRRKTRSTGIRTNGPFLVFASDFFRQTSRGNRFFATGLTCRIGRCTLLGAAVSCAARRSTGIFCWRLCTTSPNGRSRTGWSPRTPWSRCWVPVRRAGTPTARYARLCHSVVHLFKKKTKPQTITEGFRHFRCVTYRQGEEKINANRLRTTGVFFETNADDGRAPS